MQAGSKILIKHRIPPSSPSAPRKVFLAGLLLICSQRTLCGFGAEGNLQGWENKNHSRPAPLPPGCFLLLLLSLSVSHCGRTFEECIWLVLKAQVAGGAELSEAPKLGTVGKGQCSQPVYRRNCKPWVLTARRAETTGEGTALLGGSYQRGLRLKLSLFCF